MSYIVAPYEADAQMTFLAVSKHVAAVITEDSDLIAFGCPRVSFTCSYFCSHYSKDMHTYIFEYLVFLYSNELYHTDHLQNG